MTKRNRNQSNDESWYKNLKKIAAENKQEKKETKEIRQLRSNTLSALKASWNATLSKEQDVLKRSKLREKMDQFFKNGATPNKKGDIINLSGVHKYYFTKNKYEHVLRGIKLDIKEGEIVTILGQSGSGKSTLLNIMSGLLAPETGSVIVNQKELFILNEKKRTQFRAETLAFVFQSYNLIPSLTVTENIKVGENLRNKSEDPIAIKEILATLGLTNQARKYPHQLSGGQNQRISIGRALAKNPRILFADEPTGALDIEKGKDVLQLLLDINKKFGTTLVLVTHNPNIAKLSDKVVYLKDGKIDRLKIVKSKKKVSEIKWS